MSLDNNLSLILKKIIKEEKHSSKMQVYLLNLKNYENLNDNIIIFLLKSILLIISYFPEKIDIVLCFFKSLSENDSESKRDLINNLKEFDLNGDFSLETMKNEEFDYLVDKIIFKTFEFIELIYNLEMVSFNLSITLLNEIILNAIKLKSSNALLKLRVYILFLRNAYKTVKENDGSHVYLKIVDTCNSIVKIINNYLKY